MSSFKDQGNEEFKKENYLKAAALYTKAIKEDPQNAVLYSNRSAALLKLNKVSKALEDAEACIALKPDWEKGYFRKGAVLEALDKMQEALDVYQSAVRLSGEGGNKELANKIRTLSKLLKFKQTHKEESLESLLLAAAGVVNSSGQQQPQQQRLAEFLRDMAGLAAENVAENGAAFSPSLHFLPGSSAGPHEEREAHVSAAAAFGAPELLGDFVGGMRAKGGQLAAEAVLALVPKAAVQFPQLWTRKGWPAACGSKQQPGLFVQLETRAVPGARHAWFVPVRADKSAEPPVALSAEDFALLPVLLA